MASTYTTNLLLEKIGSGEQASSWDDTQRTTYDVVDHAICGVATISATTGTTTLADANNTADAAKAAVINVPVTLTGALSIVVPNRSHIYHVRNATSGAYTVGIKTSSGTALTITQGYSTIVWVDGADNVHRMCAEVANNI